MYNHNENNLETTQKKVHESSIITSVFAINLHSNCTVVSQKIDDDDNEEIFLIISSDDNKNQTTI